MHACMCVCLCADAGKAWKVTTLSRQLGLPPSGPSDTPPTTTAGGGVRIVHEVIDSQGNPYAVTLGYWWLQGLSFCPAH